MPNHKNRVLLFAPLVVLAAALPARAGGLTVYQGLDEATARIARLDDKPVDQLIDKDGFYQSETLIFTDTRTGHEIWSLTMEKATELANIERRGVFSADGSVFSMKGNRAFRQQNGKIHHTAWAGHNFLMEADLTHRRKLWVNIDGKLTLVGTKFDTWSQLAPRRLYYVIEDRLYRVDVGRGLDDNRATLLYRFPNDRPKILQNIADNDLLIVQDANGETPDDAPLMYVIDPKRKPSDPLFVRSRSFNFGGMKDVPGHEPRNEYHVHALSINRAGTVVTWNYGPSTSVGEYVGFSLPVAHFADGKPAYRTRKSDPFGQYMSHPGIGPDGRIAYFGGPVKSGTAKVGHWGLWERRKGQAPPVYVGGPSSGGHVSWNSFDPEWFVAGVSRAWPDKPYAGTLVAARADPSGSMAGEHSREIIIAYPYDRQRPGKAKFAGIPRPTQSPDATKVWYHSSMLMPDDAYTGSFIVVFRRPYAPTALTCDGTTLSWTPHPLSREIRSWIVYRRTGEQWHAAAMLPKRRTSWKATQPGVYMVTALEWSGLESDLSSPTIDTRGGQRGKPVRQWDQTPPATPTGLTVKREAAGRYRLTWHAPASPGSVENDLRYYNLYCSEQGPPKAVQARRFVSPPTGTTTYLDWTAPRQGPVYYAVTAVDRQGNESKPTFVAWGK